MNPPVSFTVDFTAEGTRTLTFYKNVPKAEFHLMELKLHALRGETLGWTTATLLGDPPAVTGEATGNFAISYVADGGANWTDGCSQNGIPQDAADHIVSQIKAALAPLAKYVQA